MQVNVTGSEYIGDDESVRYKNESYFSKEIKHLNALHNAHGNTHCRETCLV